MRAETQRVRQAYRRRDTSAVAGRYAPLSAANRLMVHSREMAFVKLLAAEGLSDLGGKRILEVGCGGAGELSRLVGLGASPELLYGIDLLAERLPTSPRMRTLAHLVVADGARLPFGDGTFDVVMQVTTFTSILDPALRRQVAADMQRVLAPGGCVLWYDFFLDNPRNPDVRGVGRRELRSLFPGSDVSLRRVTLAPPLGRAVAPRSILLARALEALPLLRSHYAGVVRPRA
ncbi:MAG TPA: methyltransferase domain-containing protein [Acidimicrobiales bacterium]|nr:methyltransferase domain-containing protein [Acidimicrobiales bacterium]